MLRAASDLQLQERRIAEAWCEAAHVPTRSEVDELQRTVTELRRELRMLRRSTEPHATAAPAVAAVTVRKARPSAKRTRS